ncbi:Hypothetical predicted protein [Mytilus galloprovincialis]|uniref:Uncharacterized protein n=1 Tax=Mytilus galloprovincialis TaxID=29158 RepID=A0A8B6EJC3_MYTGA|nr:Hypothetical predicted protein [Mytilus galloprovincialis]
MNQSSFSQDTNFYCPNPNYMFPSHSQSQQMCSTPNTGMISMPMQHVSSLMLSTMKQRLQWVDELFSRTERFENKLDHLISKVTKLENTTKALDDCFCQIESSTQYISNEFETQKNSLSNIKTEVDKLAKQLTNNHVNDEKLSKTIDQVKRKMIANSFRRHWKADNIPVATSFTDYVTEFWVEGYGFLWNHEYTEGPRLKITWKDGTTNIKGTQTCPPQTSKRSSSYGRRQGH